MMADDQKLKEKLKRDKPLLRVAIRTSIARASDQQLDKTSIGELVKQMTDTRLDNSQIRNLENLAYTTDKVSDITDFLKKLIGRDTRRLGWAKEDLGRSLINELDSLRTEANDIVAQQRDRYSEAVADDPDLPRRVHLELCREFVKHLAADYMFQK